MMFQKSNLPQQNTINQYVADSKTAIFNYTFLILIDEDIAVYVTNPGDSANPEKDLQVLNQDYTVQNAGTMTGGTITFTKNKIPTAGSIVTLVRSMQVGIETEFGNAQTFNGHTLDAAFERVLLIMQQFQTQLSTNALQYIINSYLRSNLDNKLPVLTTRDNQVWVSQGGNIIAAQIENTDVSTLRSELASQAPNGGDGTHLIGYYDILEKKGKTLQTYLSQLQTYLDGFLPKLAPDNAKLGLPVYAGKSGLFFYDGDIGKVFLATYSQARFGELSCDGANYLYSEYSSDGIPYKRLGDVLLDGGTYPKFGTGVNFVSANVIIDNLLTITTNTPGAATAAKVGTSGFTIATRVTGNNYNITGYHLGNDTVYIKQTSKGAVAPPAANTASPCLTVTDLRNVYENFSGRQGQNVPGTSNSFQIFSIQVISADNAIAGTYFTFSTTTVNYYVWFTVDGKGNDPAPPELTGIKIDFSAAMNVNERASFIAETLGGHQITTVACTNASSITAGNFFQFSTHPSAQNYYVWYRKDKTGVDPSPGGIGIVVDILSSDMASDIANKTRIAINKFYVTVPDARGNFIRIWNNGAAHDPDTLLRAFPYGQGQIAGDAIGSFQFDEIYSHSHSYFLRVPQNPSTPPTRYVPNFESTQLLVNTYDFATGGSESRPINTYFNMFIKY